MIGPMTQPEPPFEPPMQTLMAELLFARPPALDVGRLLADVQRSLPETSLVGNGQGGPMLAHERYTATFADGKRVPILTTFLLPDDPTGRALEGEHDLSQTWSWPEAGEALARCTTSLAVAEMMGTIHQPRDRVRAFRTSLVAAAAQTAPVATWWPHSNQVVPPQELQRHELVGIVNVRLFRIEDDPGAVVMDTLGLHVLGLPDLQCHFRTLDPSAMASFLYDTAAYVYEHGDVIEDGHTISGLRGDERWPCQHEEALVAPQRVVLDVDVGHPHAAGVRD